MQSFEYRFGSLLVQRDQWDTSWGAKKIFFLIRDIDGPAMAAASMDPVGSQPRGLPGVVLGRQWSRAGAYTACADASIDIYILGNSLSQTSGQSQIPPSLGFRALWGAQALAYAVQATTHYQTYPERLPGADLPPKKVSNLDPMAAHSR